jgi:hypothetical protein
VPHAFPDVVNGCFDMFVHAMEFVMPRSVERPIDLSDGFMPLAMVAVDGVFKTVLGCLQVLDGPFRAPVPFRPLGVFQVIEGFFEFASLDARDADDECEGEHDKD